MLSSFNPCALLPVYNHDHYLTDTIAKIRELGLTVVIVNDGSNAMCSSLMQSIATQDPRVILIEHECNLGKGAAIKTGLQVAHKRGFSHVLQIDADGQHNTLDIPHFLAAAEARPGTLIAGMPDYDASVPTGRFYARYLTHIWVWINTLSLSIRDSMCGFRVYPLARSCALIATETMGNRMDFETEFMVRWRWRNWPLQQLSTRVIYPENGVSHFLAWRDNKLISWMHTRMFFGMLWRLPCLLLNKLRVETE